MHGAQQHLWMHVYSPQKCIWTRACAPMQRCRSFFAMEVIADLSSALREHQGGYPLPPILLLARRNQSPDAEHAQEICPNPRHLMTRSPLWCCTSIIRSSTLVQTSSSLSIGRTCAWPRRLPVTKIHFHCFSRDFDTNWLHYALSSVCVQSCATSFRFR